MIRRDDHLASKRAPVRRALRNSNIIQRLKARGEGADDVEGGAGGVKCVRASSHRGIMLPERWAWIRILPVSFLFGFSSSQWISNPFFPKILYVQLLKTRVLISYASIVSSSSSSFKYLLMACEILTSYLNRRVKKKVYPDQDPAVFELV